MIHAARASGYIQAPKLATKAMFYTPGIELIRNPVTGERHFISIHPHGGFEFREAEIASSTFWARGELEQKYSKCFAAITYVSYGPHGIIPGESLPAPRS